MEKEFDFITFDDNEVPEVAFNINLPLGLNEEVEISQGNIILVAGDNNAGKTSFVLNILKDNKANKSMRYISSEMGKSEFKKRFATFGLPLNFWKQNELVDYVRKSSDFHVAIRPDAINIIDYLEFKDSEYFRAAEFLTKIHDALTTGIAIVCIQKKEGQSLPRAGDLVLEKPRLALAFSKYPNDRNEYPEGLCKVLKCKFPKHGKFDGKKCRFELQQHGSRFHVLNDWGFLRF